MSGVKERHSIPGIRDRAVPAVSPGCPYAQPAFPAFALIQPDPSPKSHFPLAALYQIKGKMPKQVSNAWGEGGTQQPLE